MTSTESITRRFLAAVESRNVDSVLECFAPNGTWQNVPHRRAEGHDEIRTLLEAILGRSEKVQWDLVTASYSHDKAWLERVDRFWIDGVQYAVECNGVLEFDLDAGVINELRDYVDLGEWRSRLAKAQL